MKIGIIGAGNIGSTLAKLWTQAGHEVLVSSRHPEQLTNFVERLGDNASAGTVNKAAQFGDVLAIAIPLRGVVQLAKEIGEYTEGKIILDAMNPFPGRDGEIAEEIQRRGLAAGVATQNRFPDAKVVRAFSSVHYRDLRTEAGRDGDRVAIPIAGDTKDALEVAEQLIRDAGFEPYHVGSLNESIVLDPNGVLFGKTLTVSKMKSLLE